MSSDDPTSGRPGDDEPTSLGPDAPLPGDAPGRGGPSPAGQGDTGELDPRGDTDEVASALLDGLFDDGDATTARQRPEVRERIAQLDAARGLVQEAPPAAPGAAARERSIAAALAAFDEDAGADPGRARSPAVPPAAVPGRDRGPASLAAHRARRRPGPPRWLAAAAAVAIVAAVGAGLAAVGTSDDEDTSTAALDSAEGDTDAADEGAASSAEGGDGAQPGAAPSVAEEGGEGAYQPSGSDLGDLGTYANAADLVDGVRARVAEAAGENVGADENAEDASVESQRSAESSLAARGTSCDPLPELLSSVRVVPADGTASLDGEPVTALVVVPASGSARVVVVDGDCQVLADEAL
jgi:hypothetical protein